MSRRGAIDTAGAPASSLADMKSASGAAPEWVKLIPAGAFYGRDGRGPFVLEGPAAVIDASFALAVDAGIPIDYDHATDLAAQAGAPAPAAGWIRELRSREGALWGRVEWTARAASAIAAHEYRYISPVFQYSPGDGVIRRLLRAGLTNNPNLFLTAISSAEDIDSSMEEFLAQLKKMLGMSADASFGEILERIASLLEADDSDDSHDADGANDDAHGADDSRLSSNASHHDPARFVAIAEYERAITELNAMRAERGREKAAHRVDDAIRAGRLVPAQREWALAYCSADARGFDSFIARQPSILTGASDFASTSRRDAGREGSSLSALESAICSQLGVAPADYARRRAGRGDFLRLNRDNR